jgi:large subunit ribosomal protein L10Ae
VDCIDEEGLQKFQKNKKAIKKYFRPYSILLASDSIIKKLPRLVGPSLSKLNKFPISVTHNDTLADKINEAKATIKF